jgi:predicted DsbA family dithiol-disulfide isomerase
MIIDVWSDVVCPWCFIGRRRLQKALSSLSPDVEVTIKHRAFQLNPGASGVVETKRLLSEKYNLSADQVIQMQNQVCSIADGEGLCYDLTETLSGNTRDAHRLLIWAESQGKQDDLLEAMYSSYFEKSKSLFDHESLIELAVSVGISKDDAQKLLSSDAFADIVEQDQLMANQLGINGVPFYLIDMNLGISGAQSQEVFAQTLAKALAEDS